MKQHSTPLFHSFLTWGLNRSENEANEKKEEQTPLKCTYWTQGHWGRKPTLPISVLAVFFYCNTSVIVYFIAKYIYLSIYPMKYIKIFYFHSTI